MVGKSNADVNKSPACREEASVLSPYTLVHGIAEVSGFFWKDGIIALTAFVLLEASGRIGSDTRIVHADENVFALGGIEALEGETAVGLGCDVRPQQILIVLRRLHARMHVLTHRPAVAHQPVDSQFIVRLLAVGTASVAVTVAEEVNDLAWMIAIIMAETVDEGIDLGVLLFASLDEKLVDSIVNDTVRKERS